MPKSTWVVPADTFRAFCWIVALVDNFNFDFHIDRKMVRKAARKFLVLGKKRPEKTSTRQVACTECTSIPVGANKRTEGELCDCPEMKVCSSCATFGRNL